MRTTINTASLLVRVFRSFNVAAICALGVWHAYVFYLNQHVQTRQTRPASPRIEFQRIDEPGKTNTSTLQV
ncbi:hypothetical protein [Undibacterium sp. TJN19]|uniref:hypothetical protein n=1 Tax=Undibacterium sp. TJN19 TaxID=3413055 RepID=UPI003BF1B554